jgi:hypothetical protein
MYYNRTGVGNTAVGAFAQLHDDTGSYNTSIGVQSFEYAHGDSNTMLGAQAGRYVTGSYNTYLGRFNGNQNGYDFRTGSNFIVISDGQSKIRAYYDGNENKWVWNADGTATAELTSTELSVNVPVVATGFTGSLYGTASVADGIDVIFAGVYESGSGSYIIPTPSGGLSYITSASYALTASYAMNGGGGITNTGSFATTGSNVFVANQTVTGSLYISQNLYVQGSSSISYVSQSTLNIGTNVITVNVQNPSTRFGGLSVIDSGSSPQRSGSLFFDSVNDQWIFIHQNQTNPTSSILIMGPQTYNNIGNETSLTTNVIPKSINAEHIGDSQISDNGTTVSITNGLSVGTSITATSITASVSGALTGTFPYASLTGRPTGLVSSSLQINTGSFSGSITTASYAVTASYALNASATLPVGTVSSSTQISTLGFVTSSGTASFATTASNTFSGNQTITGSLLTNADTLIFSGSMYTSGSVSVTGSLQATHFILPTVAPTTPQTGSMYFSGSFIYVYTGTQYRSASLV